MDQPFADLDIGTDDQTRPSVGIRPILHAALIFDPDFIPPPPTIYRLPRRPRPLSRAANEPKKEHVCPADAEEDDRGLEGRGAASASTAQNPEDIVEQSNKTLQQLFDHLFGDQPTPSNSIRWQTLSSRHETPLHDETTSNIDAATSPQASFNSPESHSTPIADSSYDSNTTSSNTSSSESQQCPPSLGFLRVTDEELELLDYDGTRGRQGNDALYTCTDRAASIGHEEMEDRGFETAFRSVRWSM